MDAEALDTLFDQVIEIEDTRELRALLSALARRR
jgi:hypothetical protein